MFRVLLKPLNAINYDLLKSKVSFPQKLVIANILFKKDRFLNTIIDLVIVNTWYQKISITSRFHATYILPLRFHFLSGMTKPTV